MSDDLLERARNAYHQEYHRHWRDGGDAQNHDEAHRCGLEAVLALAAPAREDAEPFHAIYHDAQDEQVAVGCYDIGIGPAVVFDGGGFTDPATLRALAVHLTRGADWLARHAARHYDPTTGRRREENT